jgi:Integrase core domain
LPTDPSAYRGSWELIFRVLGGSSANRRWGQIPGYYHFIECEIAKARFEPRFALLASARTRADLPKNRKGPTARFRGHPFDRVFRLHSIDHRLTKPNHPWTNRQVERVNRTIKEATVQGYHYDSNHQLRAHLSDFIAAYNFATRLKTLGGLTAYEFICKCWQKSPTDLLSIPSTKCRS